MTSKTPWIVCDAAKQEMRCNRCRHTEPLSRLNGSRLDFAVEILNGFVNLHEDCEEAAPLTTAPESDKVNL